jgi:aminopeptidase N
VSSPVDLSRWDEFFLAHEIAHQWWGQGVTWKRYQDQWISEGLAQFSALLYLREKHGEKSFENMLKKISKWVEKKGKWGAVTMGARISSFDVEAYQTIVYNKSALILNMFKNMLGDEHFFSGLKAFFSRFKFQAANTGDFFRTFKDVMAEDYGLFYKRWFESYTLPDIKVDTHVSREAEDYLLEIEVEQISGPFVFPLTVSWKENGQEVAQSLHIKEKTQMFRFKTAFKPVKIKVNPDYAVPGKIR